MSPSPETYDVLVVGAGPSGLTTALAATRAGAHVLVVDRHAGTTIFPKATGLRPRTMELLRSWGLEDEVRAGSQDLKVAGAIQSVLTGPVLQEFPVAAAAPEVLARMSPTDFAVAPQDHLEPVLLATAAAKDQGKLPSTSISRSGTPAAARMPATVRSSVHPSALSPRSGCSGRSNIHRPSVPAGTKTSMSSRSMTMCKAYRSAVMCRARSARNTVLR